MSRLYHLCAASCFTFKSYYCSKSVPVTSATYVPLQFIKIDFIAPIIFWILYSNRHCRRETVISRWFYLISSKFVAAIWIRWNIRGLLLVFVFNSWNIHLELYLRDILGCLSTKYSRLRFLATGNDRIIQTLLSTHQSSWLKCGTLNIAWRLILILIMLLPATLLFFFLTTRFILLDLLHLCLHLYMWLFLILLLHRNLTYRWACGGHLFRGSLLHMRCHHWGNWKFSL